MSQLSSAVAALPAQDEDFVALFMEWSEGSFSPEIHRKWTAISLIAASLERRVWFRARNRRTYPNLYTFLVAPPGVGKQIIDDGREMAAAVESPTGTPAFKLAPDSMTKASLVDELAKSKTTFLPPKGEPLEYHSLFVMSEEVAVLLPSYDLDFIGLLNKLYNNPVLPHKETRRTGSVREVSIPFPQLNLLAGVQPGWLASTFPEEAWSTGLTARLIMVYAPETPVQDLFGEVNDNSALKRSLVRRLGSLSRLHGEFSLTPGAIDLLGTWHLSGGPPAPHHSKLEHYNRRRTQHLIKLCMVSSASRSGRLLIDEDDFERGLRWLTEAEALMPDIFRAMVGRSDRQILEELHYYVTSMWKMQGQKPLAEALVMGFLADRVPSDKIIKLLEVADRTGVIQRVAGTTPPTYIPKARFSYGVE